MQYIFPPLGGMKRGCLKLQDPYKALVLSGTKYLTNSYIYKNIFIHEKEI
jgi:hypothetical protein